MFLFVSPWTGQSVGRRISKPKGVPGFSSDDRYEDCDPYDTCDCKLLSKSKSMSGSEGDSYEDRNSDPAIPVTVSIFHKPRGSDGLRATKLTRIATPTRTIPATVHISHAEYVFCFML